MALKMFMAVRLSTRFLVDFPLLYFMFSFFGAMLGCWFFFVFFFFFFFGRVEGGVRRCVCFVLFVVMVLRR